MRKEYRLFREQKSKLFTQKQAEQLSGLTRNQLRKLEDAGLVVPHRYSLILYDWNQIIFLKILHNLRQDWTFQQIEKALTITSLFGGLEIVIKNIDTEFTALAVIQEEDSDLVVQLLKNIEFEDELFNQNFQKTLQNKIDEKISKIITTIATDDYKKIKKSTVVVIPDLIKHLRQRGEELQIQDFDLKVG
ncbi:MAG: hypothetical protein FWK04_29600 [Nostoc sp. GBBB01]|nr:hypothetical protein [Nostoc sp. GBBB01]